MLRIPKTSLLLALAVGIGTWMMLIFIGSLLPEATADSTLSRLVTLLGGSSAGYIQAAVYSVFVYAFFLLRERRQAIQQEFAGLRQGLLPEQDQLVLTPEEVAGIKLEVIRREQAGQVSLVGELIKKACAQFRNAGNVGETLQVFEAQLAGRKEATEGGLEIVRYLSGAIVSLGFIGTLIGLSQSIGLSHLARTEEGMSTITGSLNVAFDTTLVALVAGLVLNFLYHRYLAEVDTFYSLTRAYVIDNLISRIYRPEEASALQGERTAAFAKTRPTAAHAVAPPPNPASPTLASSITFAH